MLEFPENIILENERVLLRSLEPSDLEHLLPFAINEPSTWAFSLISPAGEKGMRDYVNNAVKQHAEKKRISIYCI